MTLSLTRPADPDCSVCSGSGEDPDFGGTCSMCWGVVEHRGGIGETLRAHNAASHSGSGSSTSVKADDSWKSQVRWTKEGGEWVVVVPRAFRLDGKRVGTGDTVTVTSRNGEKVVTLGVPAGLGSNPYGDLLFFAAQDIKAPVAPAAPVARTNRFAGVCVRCGGEVEAEAGTCAKVDGRWVVDHVGECPAPSDVDSVPAGHYAIASEGENDLMFVRVDRNAGYPVRIKMIVGGHPDTTIPAKRVKGILARIIEAGVEAAAVLYGHELGQCCRCNRTLTDETSRAAGIGPECAKKGW
jgi:hypothetical protein